jgi:hypothetical protein
MAHDVFISYATDDRQVAEKVCTALESGGIKCWIAPRDVPFGADYAEAIVDGISSSRLIVLILSSHSNASPHVKREIENAYSDNSGRAVLPLRIENIEYNKALRYFLGSAQWLDASTPPLEQHLDQLVEQVRAHLARTDEAAQGQPPAARSDAHATQTAAETAQTPPTLRAREDAQAPLEQAARRRPPAVMWVAAGVGAFVLIAFVTYLALWGGADADNVNSAPPPANVKVNSNNASPTPQRTPAPTPTPNASPTPSPRPPLRNFNLSRNLNLRRVPESKP